MIIVMFFAIAILTVVLILACAKVWETNGLEIVVFLLGGTSVAILAIPAIQYSIIVSNKEKPKVEYKQVTETFYRKVNE